MIALDDVGVALGGRDVVAGVSAAVRPGDLIAIVGPNGAGKTTLLRVIAGLLAPSRGRVRCFGEDPARGDRRRLARQLAYVPQRYELAFPFTALEVVLFGRYPHRRGPGLDAPDDVAAARAALARFELAGLEDRRFDQLSGGEQRMVLLAQAICQGATCLLLDEPTAALDPAHARAVLAGVRAGVDAGGSGPGPGPTGHRTEGAAFGGAGAAAVVVTHDLNLAARFATALWVLAAGRLCARGRPDEVLAGAAIRAAFAVDLHVGEAPGGVRFVVPL